MSLVRVARIGTVIIFAVPLLLASCGGGGDDSVTPPVNEEGTNTAKIYDLFPGVVMHGVDRTYRTAEFTDDPKEWDPILDLISQAQSSLDIAVMRIDRQQFVDALLTQSGSVHIRIVTEKAYYEDPLYLPFYQQLLNPLRNNGNIEIATDNDGAPRLMHSRFMIIDRAKVALGSYDFSVEGSERTTGDVLVISDARIAEVFTNQFNQMFVERKFGVTKRDAVQHAFSIAGGAGQIEVWFGPTDDPRDILMSEIDASVIVIAAVQQFSDFTMANHVLQWLGGNTGAAPTEDRSLYLTINDIGAYGDEDENIVYDALVSGMSSGGQGGQQGYPAGFFVNQPPNAIWANVGMHLNHKYMYADHAGTNGVPSVVVSSGNWTTQGFNLNDEVMVILRGSLLTSKYHYAFWFQAAHLGEEMSTRDVREDAQVFLMHPFTTNLEAEDPRIPRDPALADLSCGLIHGRVTNFQPEVTYQDADGNLQTIYIDIQWEITGEYYFGGDITGYVNPLFDENERTNPEYNYILAVPAGRIEVKAVVTDPDGSPIETFTAQTKTVDICPGGVRQLDFTISTVQSDGADGGGAG